MDIQLRLPDARRVHGGRIVIERRMSSLAVVETLNVVEDVRVSLRVGDVPSVRGQLALERVKEALDDGVVIAVAAAAHAHPELGGTRAKIEGQTAHLRRQRGYVFLD